MKKIFISTLALLLFCAPLAAITLAELQPFNRRATLKNYPDAQTVLLYDDQQISFELDGTAVDIDDMYQKALTDKGVENLRSIPMHFNEFYEKYHIEKLELIRNDKFIPIDIKSNVRISVDNSQMAANIYDPAQKIMFVNIPDMQKNDILHLKIRRQTLHPRMKGFFTDISVLQSDDPILFYRVQYSAPEKMPLRAILVKNEVPGTLKKSETFVNNRHIYTFTAENVPQIIPEPNAPPMYLYCQRILLSSAAKWEDISRWYNDLCEGHLQKVTPEMRKFTANLVKNCKTPAEKLRKIFDFVSQDVRYMGVTTETEAPGYEPHDVNITFEKRYGVCRDKAALLVAMLRLADIPAYMTLFYAGAPKDAEVPNNYFNHAVVAARLPGTKDYILMDPTDENTSELLPAYGANKSYLVARKNGDTLRLSPEIDFRKNLLIINNKWQIAEDGTLDGSSQFIFQGINDNIYRDAFANWTSEYTRQFFNVMLNRIFPGAKLQDLIISPSNIRDLGKTLSVKLTFSVKNFVTFGRNSVILPSHNMSSIMGALNMLTAKADLAQRNYPMQFFSTAGVAEHTEIKFADKNLKVDLPEYKNTANDIFIFNTAAKFSDGVLTEENLSALNKTIISPAEYTILKNQLKNVAAEGRKKIFIHPPSVAEQAKNVLVYIDSQNVNFKDARNWSDTFHAKYKILDYAGVKSYAELSIPFDSGCENITLLEGKVTNPDGKSYKISPSEVHIMDSGDTTDAPYYAPAKLFTVKFPHVMPGSMIEYKLRIDHKNMPFYCGTFIFASDKDKLEQRVTFENLPPSFRMSDIPHGIAVSRGKNSITLLKNNMPRVEFEVKQPPLAMFNDTVYCTTVNFQEYCSEVNRRLNIAAANAEQTHKKTLQLIKNCKTPQEKVQVIRDFVDKNIRWAGPDLNDYNWIFAKADDTLKRGYGNSADRAVLLKAMLNSAGLRSEFIARSNLSGTMTHHKIRSLHYFQNDYNRILLDVYDRGKKIAVLNENSRYAPINLDLTPYNSGLNLAKKLPTTHKDIPSGTLNSSVILNIDRNLDITAEITQIAKGSLAETLRKMLSESNSQQKKQFFERKTTAFSRLAEVKKPWQTTDKKDSVVLSAELLVKNMVALNKNLGVFELPYCKTFAASVPGAADRKTPLWFNAPEAETLQITINLPENYTFADSNKFENISRNIGNIFSFDYRIEHRTDTSMVITIYFSNQSGLMDAENAAALPALKKLMLSPELNYIFIRKK